MREEQKKSRAMNVIKLLRKTALTHKKAAAGAAVEERRGENKKAVEKMYQKKKCEDHNHKKF